MGYSPRGRKESDTTETSLSLSSGKTRNNSEISYEHMDRVKEVVCFPLLNPAEINVD